MALEKTNKQSVASSQNVNGVEATKTYSKEHGIQSPSLVSEDHGVSDLSMLKILKKYDLLPNEYLENRQGHLLVNLCKGVASNDLMKDRLCFIEFVQLCAEFIWNFYI